MDPLILNDFVNLGSHASDCCFERDVHIFVEKRYGPDHRHLHGIPDEYKNLYHRDMEGARYDLKARLAGYEMDKVTEPSCNERG